MALQRKEDSDAFHLVADDVDWGQFLQLFLTVSSDQHRPRGRSADSEPTLAMSTREPPTNAIEFSMHGIDPDLSFSSEEVEALLTAFRQKLPETKVAAEALIAAFHTMAESGDSPNSSLMAVEIALATQLPASEIGLTPMALILTIG